LRGDYPEWSISISLDDILTDLAREPRQTSVASR
jgi:hypothetical protein